MARARLPWWRSVSYVCAAAVVVRVMSVLIGNHPIEITGDSYQYHHGANLLVDGKGFVDAFHYRVFGEVRESALHAPLYMVVLAIPSALGLRSPLAHQLWSSLIGTGTVALVALVARHLAGDRAGLIAAGLTAVYPNAWVLDGMLGVETLTLFTGALVLLMAYRWWAEPSLRAAVAFGAACGVAALTRGEALAYLPLIVVPMVVLDRRLEVGRRILLAGAAAAAAGAVLMPWVVFNLTRFNQPVLVSRFDVAMAPANCDDVYYGEAVGYWSSACFPDIPSPRGDESDDALVYRDAVVDYVRDNLDRLPFVVFARVGRTFGFYQPLQQLTLDSFIEGRDLAVARIGLVSYYVLVAGSVAGAIALRRRGEPLSPQMAMVATAVLAVAVTYGQTRYRATAELVPVVLSAVALDGWLRSRGRADESGQPARSPGSDLSASSAGPRGG